MNVIQIQRYTFFMRIDLRLYDILCYKKIVLIEFQ